MPGAVAVHSLTVPWRDGKALELPYWVVESGRAGPCLLLAAAQHGNELNGCEAIRRFVALVAERLVAGRVLAVPFANPGAIRERRPHIGMRPEQPYSSPASNRVNMNLHWPGNRRGSLPRRLAAAIAGELLPQATHVIDLHSWNRTWAPALLIRDQPDLRQLAVLMGPPYVQVRPPADCLLGGHACALGKLGMSFEFSGQYAVIETEVAEGLAMLTNLACAIGLFAGTARPRHAPLFSDCVLTETVPAPAEGLFVEASGLRPGQCIERGRSLGHVLEFGSLAAVPVRAPVGGWLRQFGVGRANCDVSLSGFHPYVEVGETLAQVLCAQTSERETSA